MAVVIPVSTVIFQYYLILVELPFPFRYNRRYFNLKRDLSTGLDYD